MKTTMYKLSEAIRISWGIDPYDFNITDLIEEKSIANKEGDKIIEFEVLSEKYKNSVGVDDWDIEIINLGKYPEIEIQ